MKKVIILLTLLLAVAPVFATPDIIMNAVIDSNGSSIVDPGYPETPVDPIIKGPVNVYLLYSTQALGDDAKLGTEDIVPGMNPIEDTAINEEGFDLIKDTNNGKDALYLYLYAGYNAKSTATATVTFSSVGWEYQGKVPEGTESPVIPLKFASEVSSNDTNLNCDVTDAPASEGSTESSAEFTFEATGATQNLTSFLAGISEVTWDQDSGYLAGSYQATITIEVTQA